MNCRLVTDSKIKPLDLEPIELFLQENKPDMVMISGGEPLLDPDNLEETISWIKGFGCKVGLSTNGLCPSLFSDFLSELSYVALDVKGLPAFYTSYTVGMADPETSFFRMLESWRYLRQFSPKEEYELRTTLYPEIFKAYETSYDYVPWMFLGQLFADGERWVLQEFRPTKEIMSEDAKDVEPFTAKQLDMLLNTAKFYAKDVTVELRAV